MSLQRAMRDKQTLIEFLRSRGIEPDLRQEDRSLVFAVFPVTSIGMPGDLGKLCLTLKDSFIEATAKHKFQSRIAQLTYSPRVCEVGHVPAYDFKLSHKPSENHVFASAVLDIPKWKAATSAGRRAMLISGIVGCIERIKSDWINNEDRADLMGVFLSLA